MFQPITLCKKGESRGCVLKCSLCSGRALRQVGRRGFCGAHFEDACALEAQRLGVVLVRARTGRVKAWEVDAKIAELEESNNATEIR